MKDLFILRIGHTVGKVDYDTVVPLLKPRATRRCRVIGRSVGSRPSAARR